MLIFTQLKAYLYLIVGIGFSILLFYTYHSGATHQKEVDEIALNKAVAAYQVQIQTEVDRRTLIETTFINKLDNIKVVNTTINKTLTKELTNTVYTNCKVPETGVDIINDDVTKLNLSRTLVQPK
jgi:hydroxymethylpyrimidine pyrophosphatase-like HAD family hydrolase